MSDEESIGLKILRGARLIPYKKSGLLAQTGIGSDLDFLENQRNPIHSESKNLKMPISTILSKKIDGYTVY